MVDKVHNWNFIISDPLFDPCEAIVGKKIVFHTEVFVNELHNLKKPSSSVSVGNGSQKAAYFIHHRETFELGA